MANRFSVGIGDFHARFFGMKIAQQTKLGPVRPEPVPNDVEVILLHGQDQVRLIHLVAVDGAGPQGGDIQSGFFAGLNRLRGGRFGIPSEGAGGFDSDLIQPVRPECILEHAFGHGAATDVSGADDQNRAYGG